MIVYWAHRKDNLALGEGYIGITRGFKGRQQNHLSAAKRGAKGRFYSALRKYDDIVWDILAEDLSEEDAITTEKHLRPTENMGWNMVPGGGLPPLSKKGRKIKKWDYPKNRKSRGRMKVYTICKQCGTQRLRPSYEGHRQFCSHKCGSEYKKGINYQTPEYLARLAEDMKGNTRWKKTDANLSSNTDSAKGQ